MDIFFSNHLTTSFPTLQHVSSAILSFHFEVFLLQNLKYAPVSLFTLFLQVLTIFSHTIYSTIILTLNISTM